jgi:hypothetical protein
MLSRLRTNPRAQWLVTFALIAGVTGLWSIGTPLFASADEPAHVVRAAAVGRGELTGRQDQRKDFESYVYVKLPEIYESAGRNLMCFAHRPNRDASCHNFDGSETRTTEVVTEAGRHPPAYYGLVGGISRVWPSAAGEVWLMRLVTALITALFVTMSVRALLRIPTPRIGLLGLVVALTPMVLAFGGVVNPNSPETAAGVATWACGLVLVWELRQGKQPDRGLVTALGIAASALVLSRQISMFWVALIGVILAGLLGKDALLRLARSGTARIWAVVVGGCAVAQLAWIVNQDALDLSPLPSADERLSADEIARGTVGRSGVFFYEMLGQPGWLDVTLPDLAYLLLIVALGVLVVLAIAVGLRRYAVAMLVAIAVSAVVPVALEAWQARDYGFYWQGRYTLPFAVGVPLLAGIALQSDAGRRVFRGTLVPGLAGIVVVAQVLAFYQALRRWTVGADGPVFFWLDARWRSPVPQWLLIVMFSAAVTAFVAWVLTLDRSGGTRDDDLPGLRV